MIRTLNTNSNPQPPFGVQTSTVPILTKVASRTRVLAPFQVVGMVPLTCSTPDPRLPAFNKCDCREWTNDECYINPVFASTSDTDPLKNDHNMFLLATPFYFSYQWVNNNYFLMSLNKFSGGVWSGVATLTDNTYGTFYDSRNLCITNLKGFDIDWRKVLIAFGEGLYNFSVTYNTFGNAGTLTSEPFCLKAWSCAGTDVTVRWESTIVGGRVGSITTDCDVFEFCCLKSGEPGVAQKIFAVTWRDQLRVYAFFGREKTEYERVNIEYQDGTVVQTKNEAIQKFEYESALQPKWVHDRLKAYAFMADELYVTDYNWNNADYEIDKKAVTCDGSYEPEYHEDTRYSYVKVQFKERCQNVIRDRCCNVATRPPST